MPSSANGERRPASSNAVTIIKRWDGASRLSTEWNEIRRDPELWIESGDCIVHLAPAGQSRRGPSFLVPLVALRGTKLANQARPVDLDRRQPWDEEGSFARLQMRVNNDEIQRLSELYLPAPEDCTRDQLIEWHLTTRNFFAFIFKKSLVGVSLGRAFNSLQRRLELWRPSHRNNLDDLLAYARVVGYMAFAHCPDFALAMLSVAEQNRIDNLWIDAFAHSVGMEDMLFTISDEHQNVSRPTKAYIKNYAISLNGRLQRATKSLSCFLEDDFSPAYLGINDAARAHLKDFQQFLRDFYAQKFGAWPPRTLFSKSIFKSMHSDFSHLFDYLVDLESSADLSEQGLASGGICVLQVVQAFDKRNTYPALSHPLCLLPVEGNIRRSSSKKALVALGLGDREPVNPHANVLTRAANVANYVALSAPLVKAFQRFESVSLQAYRDKLSLLDGRKIRWLLVYCTLQVLTSVMQAPLAVCDTDTNYPLCCETHGLPPWVEPPAAEVSGRPKTSDHEGPSPLSINTVMQSKPSSRHEHARSSSKSSKGQSDISPDCQQDDYIKHMEIPIPSWKDVLSMRDPSTIAIKKMKKQMENDPDKSSKYPLPKSTESKSSRYSFNLLGSRKGSRAQSKSASEQEKALQLQQARNTMGPEPHPAPQPVVSPASVTRHTSTSTGHSTPRSQASNKSDGGLPNRVDSTRTPTTAPAIRAKSLSKPASADPLAPPHRSGSVANGRVPYTEPKSPGKAEVAPWEAMEPSMSGAMAAVPVPGMMPPAVAVAHEGAAPDAANADVRVSASRPSLATQRSSGKGKQVQPQLRAQPHVPAQQSPRKKSVPLVPSSMA